MRAVVHHEFGSPDVLELEEVRKPTAGTRKVIPVIDRRYPLSETADAIRYLETGHARGKVVITTSN